MHEVEKFLKIAQNCFCFKFFILRFTNLCQRASSQSLSYVFHESFLWSVQAQEPELTVLLYNEDGELIHLPLVNSGLAEAE